MTNSTNKKLFVIHFGSIHWAYCDDEVLVWAETEDEAKYLVEPYMEEALRDTLIYDEEDPHDQKIGEKDFYTPYIQSCHEFDHDDGKMEWYAIVGSK